MKKIFVCLLAVAALAACQKNEVISTVQGPAIAFENAFVDNATKADPSYSSTNLFDQFYVWGYMDQTSGIVFSEERVAKDITNTDLAEAWKYANTQYWAANHTYTFEAVTATDYDAATVNVTEATADVVSVDFVNADGTNDLLYAAAEVKTGADVSSMAPVGLTFNHLLSKVKFSFTNGFGNDNAYITVKNIKMTVPGNGVWTVDGVWTLGETETVLAFGDMAAAKVARGAEAESQDERLTIPADAAQAYEVTFDVELYYGEVLAYSNSLLTVIEGAALEAGKAYNFHATIDASNIVPGEGEEDALKPIEFTATVSDWVTAEVYDGGVIETLSTTEAFKNALAEAVAAGSTNVVLDVKDATLNMNAMFTTALVPEGTKVTVQNANVEGRSYGNKLNGDVVFENCTFKNESGPYSIHFDGGKGNVKFVDCVLYGWNSFGNIGSVTMEGCKLYGNGTYALIRSYTALNVTYCVFDFTDANHEDEWPENVEVVEDGFLTETDCEYIGK